MLPGVVADQIISATGFTGLLYIDWNQNSGVVNTGEPVNQYDLGETDWDKLGAGGTAPTFVNSPTPYEGTYCVWIDGFSRGVNRGGDTPVNMSAYALPNSDWTIRLPFWRIDTPSATQRRRMFGLWTPSTNQSYWITNETDGSILFQTSSNGSTTTTTCDSGDNSWTLTVSTWHDLTLQRNGTAVTMVIDDVVQSKGTLSAATHTPTANTSLKWGTDEGVNNDRAWKGYFDATLVAINGAVYSEITGSQSVNDAVTMPTLQKPS